MSEALTPAEVAASAWQAIIREDARLAGEFVRSQAEFFTTSAGHQDELSQRRALEWFVLERENELHGGLLIQSLPGIDLHLGPEELASWIGSVVGVFEVSSVRPGEGVWLKDLAGGGEYPLIEPSGSQLMEAGDLIAGRIFAHEGAFVASPAAAFVREPDLLQALRADFEHARQGRRGLVRIAQSEVERLFHKPRRGHPGSVEEARELLRAGGVDAQDIDELLAHLSEQPFEPDRLTPGGDDPLGAALDQLAFETDIDLESARRALLSAWQELSERAENASTSATSATSATGSTGSTGVPRGSRAAATSASQALAEFDANRRKGLSLEQSFRELEQALGLDAVEEEDPGLVPDFPEAMAGILEEYLWETNADADERARLEPLAVYAARHGVEDNLTQAAWIDFCSRWMLEENRLAGQDQAAGFAAALLRFALWAEESHALTLWEGASAHARSLQKSLPRLAELNQRRTREAPLQAGQVMRVRKLEDGMLELDGAERARVDPLIFAWIQNGDLVRGEVREGQLALYAAYPRYEPETTT
jgi:hypothetical protein